MKKFILFGIVAFLSSGLFANPNPDPEIHINEFMFTGSNSWKIEIAFEYSDFTYFDSITIQVNSGLVRVFGLHPGEFYYFTDQDLSMPLTINPNGDRIILRGYYYGLGIPSMSELAFGNVENPDVLAPLSGQSIERFAHTNCYYPYHSLDVFTLCKYPTMGLPNDTTGCMGTLQGTMFDMDGGIITYSTVINMDYGFSSDAQGHLSTRIFSRIYSWDTLCYHEAAWQYLPGQITPISYTMIPDSVITRDIHFLEPLLVGIKPQPKKTASALNIFPNPVKDAITVSYTSELTAESGNLDFVVYDMNGKQVLKNSFENSLGVVTIPIDLTNGIYIANLSRDGKTIGTARFVVNKTE
jgi:hypothetical protein